MAGAGPPCAAGIVEGRGLEELVHRFGVPLLGAAGSAVDARSVPGQPLRVVVVQLWL